MNDFFCFVIDKHNKIKMYSECLNLIALQYKRAEKYDLMKTYYLIAIEDGNTNAMNNLGNYYHSIEKNYEEMKKYYLMAIECGNARAMRDLGYYYHSIEKNYEEMKKYYLMAIECGNIDAMNNLGQYYDTIEKNTELTKKYLLMAYPLPIAIDNLRLIAKYNPELFCDDVKNKSITLDQLCSIYANTTKLLEHLGIIYAKYEYPYVLEMIHELNKKIFGNISIVECPVCWENTECGHYPCDERHKVCRGCYWKSPNKCYYNCSK